MAYKVGHGRTSIKELELQLSSKQFLITHRMFSAINKKPRPFVPLDIGLIE